MTNQAFTETLIFTRCANWNTDLCPHLTTSHMQLSIINDPHFWVLTMRLWPYQKNKERISEKGREQYALR
jgi:hypothetical protein